MSAALQELRRAVLASGAYTWASSAPRPDSIEALAACRDPDVWETGFHSILDVFTVVDADTPPDDADSFGAVRPVTADELDTLGLVMPTEADTATLFRLATTRQCGRVATLYRDGSPHLLYFFGFPGD
ncbi:hypothetical protein [Stackebrandtia albiflava]|uniref:hypothetical protein n=1 Tax=Stackebrandtia albiflava TaxID=406432 RepID=UPI0011BEB9A3|nr:hypothetical protein [Stackebrandtia albiflava]